MAKPRWVTLPPHDLEAEAVVLSAVLWGDVEAHSTGLEPGDFWAPMHRSIWAVMLAAEELLGCDVSWRTRIWATLSVLSGLRQAGLLEVLQAAALGRLDDEVRRVRELSARRQAIELLQRAEAELRA